MKQEKKIFMVYSRSRLLIRAGFKQRYELSVSHNERIKKKIMFQVDRVCAKAACYDKERDDWFDISGI